MDSTMDPFVLSPAEEAELRRQEAEEARMRENSLPQRIHDQRSPEDKAYHLGSDNGLPGEGDISEAEAISIALTRFAAIGYDLHAYDVTVWYKLYDALAEPIAPPSDEMNPFYVIYFTDDVDTPMQVFSILIDADTGVILEEYAPAPSNG